MQRQRWVVGNWKMHGSLASNAQLLANLRACAADGVRVAVCVPFPYLAQAQQALAGSDVSWGVQDLSEHAQGAFTGEVSASMARDFGASVAIVGHSERRAYHAESSELVARKALAAAKSGLTVIACVGETDAQREAGETQAVIAEQLNALLAVRGGLGDAFVIAYEPVWAIGTGKTATPEQAQEVHAFIRARLTGVGLEGTSVLYGGSVRAANAAGIFAMPDIDGGLIGGASLVGEEFLAIATAGAVAMGV